MHPAAPASVFLKGISVTVVVLLFGAGVVLATQLHGAARLFTLVPLLIVPLAALFAVRGYAVQGHELLVRRPWWTTRIELGALQSAAVDADAGARSLRLFGNGGLFVFCGWFRNARLGHFRAFVTDWQSAVVIKASRRTVVISPADPAGFVRALQPRRMPARGQPGPVRRHVL